MASDNRPPEERDIYVGEGPVTYCIDFSNDPAITAGATIVSATITAVNGYVTVGAGTVLVAPFIEYDANGLAAKTVAIGKGVKFDATGVTKGQCEVKCQLTCSDGQKPVAALNFNVRQ